MLRHPLWTLSLSALFCLILTFKPFAAKNILFRLGHKGSYDKLEMFCRDFGGQLANPTRTEVSEFHYARDRNIAYINGRVIEGNFYGINDSELNFPWNRESSKTDITMPCVAISGMGKAMSTSCSRVLTGICTIPLERLSDEHQDEEPTIINEYMVDNTS